MEDIDIIRRMRDGDTDAFALLVNKYHRHLLNFIFRIIKNESIVEDIGQEVFLSVYRALPSFNEERGVPFSAWLFTIARNRCISEVRKKRVAVQLPIIDELAVPAASASPDEILIKKERRAALERALELLEPPFREALLKSLSGASVREIARDCAVPSNTVKTRLFRAREKLRILFQSSQGD